MTVPKIPPDFGQKYAAAWSSQHPDEVARMFAVNGSLTINSGASAVGRAAVTEVARDYMTAFPDLDIRCDRLVHEDGELRWYWTMKGTNNGPGGSGNQIDISGYEAIELDSAGRIVSARGYFDEGEYDRQLQQEP